MKHLKTFESNKEYYHNISSDDYWNRQYDIIDISTEAYNLIYKSVHGKLDELTGIKKEAFFISGRNNAFICELKDEWFTVASGLGYQRQYYLCDQLEGLSKCLDDIDLN